MIDENNIPGPKEIIDNPIVISLSKFRDIFLQKQEFSELTEDEKPFYQLFVAGIMTGRDIALIEAAAKVDKEVSDEYLRKFLDIDYDISPSGE